MWHCCLLVFIVAASADESTDKDGENSRKILGSSVVTSVSVIMDAGNGSKVYSDALGHPLSKPSRPGDIASPIDLLNPDRYEFYTFDDSGDLVKRLMTLDEIHDIVATDGDTFDDFLPEKRVNDVVNNVQNVLKEEIKLHKPAAEIADFDTPDVSDSWSMILPAVFGNSGHQIKPETLVPVVKNHPETIIEQQTTTTTTSRPSINVEIITNSNSTTEKTFKVTADRLQLVELKENPRPVAMATRKPITTYKPWKRPMVTSTTPRAFSKLTTTDNIVGQASTVALEKVLPTEEQTTETTTFGSLSTFFIVSSDNNNNKLTTTTDDDYNNNNNNNKLTTIDDDDLSTQSTNTYTTTTDQTSSTSSLFDKLLLTSTNIYEINSELTRQGTTTTMFDDDDTTTENNKEETTTTTEKVKKQREETTTNEAESTSTTQETTTTNAEEMSTTREKVYFRLTNPTEVPTTTTTDQATESTTTTEQSTQLVEEEEIQLKNTGEDTTTTTQITTTTTTNEELQLLNESVGSLLLQITNSNQETTTDSTTTEEMSTTTTVVPQQQHIINITIIRNDENRTQLKADLSLEQDLEETSTVAWIPVSTLATTLATVDLVPKPLQGFGLEDSTAHLDQDIYQFIQLCNELAFNFYKSVSLNLNKDNDSVATSPFGAISLLAMVFLGARGATSGEMNEILQLDNMVTFNPHLIFKNVTDDLESVATSTIIRQLYSDRTKGKLLPFYKERVRQFYDGHVEEVDFKQVGDVLRRRTNLLVKKQTGITDFFNGEIVPRPPLAAFSVSIFRTDCSAASVEGRDGELHFVVSPSLRQRRLVPIPAAVYRTGFVAGYEPSLDATAAALGSKDATISTIFIIPGQQGMAAPGDGLARLEKRLVESAFRKGAWSRLLRSLIPRPGLELQLPRFRHRSLVNATQALKTMGLRELFDQRADLKGLGQELHLSDVVQVNEFATCGDRPMAEGHYSERTNRELPLALRPRQARLPETTPRLRFDRPFLYVIRHNPSGLVLHMGRFHPRLLP